MNKSQSHHSVLRGLKFLSDFCDRELTAYFDMVPQMKHQTVPIRQVERFNEDLHDGSTLFLNDLCDGALEGNGGCILGFRHEIA